MSDALPEDTWSKEFQTANARPLLNSLQKRLQASTTHVHALAELYRERALIEQDYATKLSKLARSAEQGQLLGKGGTQWDQHGGEAKLWDAVLGDIQETASSHSTLAATLKSDFEGPVRDLPNKILPWRSIHDKEANIDRLLKDNEKVNAKLQKALSKNSNKVGDLEADLSTSTHQISMQMPVLFCAYQRLDEERLRGLKEVVVRWATARGDMAARDGQRAEQTAAQLLSWEPQDEVVAIGVRLGSQAGGRGSSRPRETSVPPEAETPRVSMQTTGTGASDFTPRMQRANGSTSNVSSHGASHEQSQTKGGTFGGLKSMLSRKATVAGRQRSGSEATSVRSTRRPTGDGFEPVGDGHSERNLSTPVREKPEPIPERPASKREPSGTRVSAPQVDAEGYTIAPADRHKPLWDEPNESIPSSSSRGMAAGAAGAAGVALPSALFASQRSSSPGMMQDNQSTSSSSIGETPRLNLAMAPAPIKESEDERQAALAKMQQTLSLQPQPPARRSTIARGRREARHTMQATAADAMPLPPAHMAALARMGEEEHLADDGFAPRGDVSRRRSASVVSSSSRNPFDSPGLGAPSPGLEAPSSTLERAPSPQGRMQPPAVVGGAAVAGLAAGAGAAVLGTHSQSNGTSALPTANAAAPSPPTAPPVPLSPTASLAGASQAPTMPARPSVSTSSAIPGLNASITETVHALIRQNQVVQTMVNGEIRLSLAATRDQPLPPPGSKIHIRLTEFENLESISPNPAFLAQVPDAPGEYYLNTDAVAHATAQAEDGSPRGPVLFQYQALERPDIAPLTIKPAFQVKAGETRMILHYRVTPGAGLADLNLAVTFPREPEVTTTQSKPVSGTWSDSPDGKAITYRVLPGEGVDNKIIARFITSGALAPVNVDAHFACPGRVLSGIGLETVEDGQSAPGWTFAGVHRATMSGKYGGEPSVNP
ncbi:hypothetical protein CC85DRAFT_285156 [Cutaneotrichosporon oleaginosum]|uniref:MHD domain-containing protein n=1 Tax=Cutaneotrichosporon oleaginosum TaxID=879819 RepID=A0A0J0XNW7_9TREE|nr:uncharacterized protein CC85DRAFT_285156 [Cutaneotrichosporon oleaginosum]KLT42810.1 hypothetical protein CC85DRAFT_285156 [Cutaneotrichosporon oleaginosum]TXT08222.1 hypothetical protein COLE_05146 [Cutaneotrichosporon oleaginosum]